MNTSRVSRSSVGELRRIYNPKTGQMELVKECSPASEDFEEDSAIGMDDTLSVSTTSSADAYGERFFMSETGEDGFGSLSELTPSPRGAARALKPPIQAEIVSQNGTVRGKKNYVRENITNYIFGSPFVQGGKKDIEVMRSETGKIVIYTTSNRVIRGTFERCQKIVKVFQNHRVKYDEKDININKEHKREVLSRMGLSYYEELPQLPQVFIDGQHVGNLEKLLSLNETGELRKILSRFEKHVQNSLCEMCGGYKFIPCTFCNGSKKSNKNQNIFTSKFGSLKCTKCHQNGLQNCPKCSGPETEENKID